MLVASALIVVVSGGLARHVGQVLGIGSTAVTAWNIAKWPVLLIIVILMISILYWVAPNANGNGASGCSARGASSRWSCG